MNRTEWSLQDYRDRLQDVRSLTPLIKLGLMPKWRRYLYHLDRKRGRDYDPPPDMEDTNLYLDPFWDWLFTDLIRDLDPLPVFAAYLRDYYGSWDAASGHLRMTSGYLGKRIRAERKPVTFRYPQPSARRCGWQDLRTETPPDLSETSS